MNEELPSLQLTQEDSQTGLLKEITLDQDEAPSIRVYKRRWLMLFLFSMVSMSSSIAFSTFPPISLETIDFYNTSVLAINTLSMEFYFLYVLFGLSVGWFIEKKTLKGTVMFGCILTSIGAWIRWILSHSRDSGIYTIFLGQTLAAIGQIYIVGSTLTVSAYWFSFQEKTLATSIAFLLNNFGIAFGFIVAPIVVKEGSDIPNWLLITAIICTIFSVAFCVFFQNKPPIPPSLSAATKREPYRESLKYLIKNKNFILLWFGLGVNFGAFNGLVTLLEQIAFPAGYNTQQVGTFGYVVLFAGLVGDLAAGIFDRLPQKYYKYFLWISFVGSSVGFIYFCWAIQIRDNFASIILASCVLGFFTNLCCQICLQLSVEVSFPAEEGAATNIQIISLQFFGSVFILFMSVLEGVDPNASTAIWVPTALVIIISLVMFAFQGSYKRAAVDAQSPSLASQIQLD